MIEERDLRAAVEAEFGTPLTIVPYGRAIRAALARVPDGPCLVPARMDTGWWWDYCRHGEVRFLRGRVRFEGERSGAPFPSALIVFGVLPRTGWWDVNSGELSYADVVYWDRTVHTAVTPSEEKTLD